MVRHGRVCFCYVQTVQFIHCVQSHCCTLGMWWWMGEWLVSLVTVAENYGLWTASAWWNHFPAVVKAPRDWSLGRGNRLHIGWLPTDCTPSSEYHALNARHTGMSCSCLVESVLWRLQQFKVLRPVNLNTGFVGMVSLCLEIFFEEDNIPKHFLSTCILCRQNVFESFWKRNGFVIPWLGQLKFCWLLAPSSRSWLYSPMFQLLHCVWKPVQGGVFFWWFDVDILFVLCRKLWKKLQKSIWWWIWNYVKMFWLPSALAGEFVVSVGATSMLQT